MSGCGGRDALPGSGMIDGLDVGMQLGLDLRDLEPVETGLDGPALQRISALSEFPADQVKLYRAETRLGDEELPLRLAVAELPESGHLAVAMDEAGVVRATALWGGAAYDTDRDGAWMTFCTQFKDRVQPLRIAETLGPVEVDRYWVALEADPSPEAAVTRALYRHRRLMISNSQHVRATMRQTARGDTPPFEAFRRWKRVFEEVASLSDTLADAIGPRAAERHRILAEEAVVQIDGVLSAVQTQEPRAVRKLVSGPFTRATCTACHSAISDRFGGEEIYRGLRSRMPELGVRRDLLRAGFDLWSVPNEDRLSQLVADGFKAIFLVMGESSA